KDLVRAKLENLWLTAMDYCPDGRLTVASRPLTADDIAEWSGWHGDATVWLRSLIEAGWIDELQGGVGGKTLYLHDWQDYGGKMHAARLAERERKAKKGGGRNSGGIPVVGGGRAEQRTATAEERRAEQSRGTTPEPSPPPAAPTGLPPADLREALETPDRGVGLLLLAAAAPDLDPRLAEGFAAEIPVRELAAACDEAPIQTNPSGWLRRALEGRWKREAKLSPQRMAELGTQIVEARVKAARKHMHPGITSLRPKTPRKEGETEEDYLRRVQAARAQTGT
ncbi:MAG TPA: hypothetical protein VEJ18_10525, partial [Planctomycetota bacterium]|nr:hypothetical protein [Planctomycetota bacterium]